MFVEHALVLERLMVETFMEKPTEKALFFLKQGPSTNASVCDRLIFVNLLTRSSSANKAQHGVLRHGVNTLHTLPRGDSNTLPSLAELNEDVSSDCVIFAS